MRRDSLSLGVVMSGALILLKICSEMLRAISFSPIMIRFAPNLFKYSTSASEWARAIISNFGLVARACSMKLPLSNGFGIALINHLAELTLAASSSPG